LGLTIAFTTVVALGAVWTQRHPKFQIPTSKLTTSQPNHQLPITNHISLFVLIVVFPPLLVYALSLTPVSFFAPKIQARYLLVLLPAYTILLALGVAMLKRFSIWLAIAAAIFILGANILVLNEYYADGRLTDDYATLVNTLKNYARQGDAVLLDTDQEWPTFLYYLRAPLDWIGVPNGKPMDATTADALVQRTLNRNSAVWLVTIPDALATDPQKLVEARLARELPKQMERTVNDKRLVLYASTPRDWVAIPRENVAPQFLRADRVDANAQLIGFDLPTRELNAGDILRIVTYWRTDFPAMVSVRVSGLVTATLQMPHGEILRYEIDFVLPPDAAGEFPLMVNQIELARIRITPQEVVRAGSISRRVDYRLGDSIRLIGYDLPRTSYRAGDNVSLTLHWRAEKPVAKSYAVFVHLVGEKFNPKLNNPLWGQVDRIPSPPSSGWRIDEIVPDPYVVKIDADAPPGKYKIEIGMYDAATGVRLATDSGDSIVIDEIEIH